MRYIILFCLFFILTPSVISAYLHLARIVRGPEDSSLYHQQIYSEMLKKAIPELVALFFIILGIFVMAIVVVNRYH